MSYPSASLTADIIVVAEGHVLLIERGGEPFAGMLALPGGFINARNDDLGEEPVNAAARELYEETGVVGAADRLRLLDVRAKPGRDPRGRVVSFVYGLRFRRRDEITLAAGDDAATAGWYPLNLDLLSTPMAFDHQQILRDQYELMLRTQGRVR